MHSNHLMNVLIGGVVILVALMIVGLPFGTALPYALLLACALMMSAMTLMMMRGPHRHIPAGDQQQLPVRSREDRPVGPRRP